MRATDAVGRTTLHPGTFTVLAMIDIVSLSPEHGSVTNDSPLTISAVFEAVPLSLAQCSVTVDGVHFGSTAVGMTQQGFSFDPGAGFETQGPHTAIVSLRAVSGVSADATTTFTYDTLGPVIAPSNFTNGGTVFTSTPLRWSITDAAGVATAQISVDGQGAQPMTDVGGGLYEYSVSAIGPHTYVVTAVDAVGNPNTHPGSFTVQYQADPENPATGSGPLPLLSPPNIPGGADSASHGLGAQETLGQGVNAFSGQFSHSQSILSRSGRGLDFELIATYRNQAGPLSALGDGWDLNYFMKLVPDSGDYLFHAGNGRVERFRSVGAEYISYQLPYKLVTSPLSLKTPSGTVFSFDAGNGGRLTAITDRNGNAITCTYTGSQLTSITDTLGIVTNLIYSGGMLVRVEEVRVFGGGVSQARYVSMDHSGSQLRSISMPLVPSAVEPATRFLYTGADLTSIANRNYQTWLENTYDAQRRVVRQVCGAGAYNFAYTTVGIVRNDNQLAVMHTTCNDRMGFISEYWLNSIGNCIESSVYGSKAANADAPSTPSSNWATVAVAPLEAGQVYTTRMLYSGGSRSPGLLKKYTQPMGSITQWQIAFTDVGLNPLGDRRAEFNVTGKTQTSDGRPGTSYSTINESWVFATNAAGAGVFDRVGTYTSPRGNITTYTLDPANGDVLAKTLPNVSSGAMPGEATGLTWGYTYNSFGQVLTETDPSSAGVQSTISYIYGSVAATNNFGRMTFRTQNNLSLVEDFHYNLAGDVITYVDRRNITRSTQYNVRRKPTISNTALGFLHINVYDNEDNLVERREQTGGAPPFHSVFTAYNSLNSPVSVTEPLNAFQTAQSVSVRNASNVVVATVSPEGAREETDFNTRYKPYQIRTGVGAPVRPAGSTPGASAYSDVASRNVSHEYNANGELVKTSLPSDGTVDRHSVFRQDGFGRAYESEDAYGAITRNVLDADGQVVRAELYGQLQRGTGGNVRLRETQNVWNEAGRLAQVDVLHFDPITQANIGDGINRTLNRYLRCGVKAETENDLGHVWHDGYDAARRHITVTDHLGSGSTKTLDENGNATQVDTTRVSTGITPPGTGFSQTLQNFYDLENRWTGSNSGGFYQGFQYESRQYGPRGEILHITRGGGGPFGGAHVVWYQYDAALRLTDEAIIDVGSALLPPDFNNPNLAYQSLTHWDLDLDGNVVAKIDPRQNMWQMARNDRGEMELTTNPDATTVDPEYSVAGYMSAKTDEKGNRITYTVGSDLIVHGYTVTQLGSDTAGLAQGGTMAGSYFYNAAGEMVLATDEDSRVARGFDSQGNMLSDTQREPGNLSGLDVPVVCTVNALGQPLTQTVPDGGRGARVITNTYHGNDLLATVRDTAVSAVSDMVQVDWSGEAPYQWVTGVNQPVTERIENFDGATMLPNQRTLTKNGITFMDFNQAWNADGATPLAYIHNTNSNLSGVFTQPADIRNEFQGIAWLGAGNYAAISRDKNTNLISDNAVAQVFNTRNGITSRAADPWVHDGANFVMDINEGSTRKHFITDALGHVVGFERYVSNILQEAWLDRFDALGRRISKAQTVGGSGYTAFVYFGDEMMETRTPWSTTLDRFGTVLGERRYTETATGITRHHVGPDGNTAYSTNESTGVILAGSNYPADPGLIQRVPGRDAVFDGTTGSFALASQSLNNTLANNQGNLLGTGFYDQERFATTSAVGTVYVPNGEPIAWAQDGAPSVGTTGISVESMRAQVFGLCGNMDSQADGSRTGSGIFADQPSFISNLIGQAKALWSAISPATRRQLTGDERTIIGNLSRLADDALRHSQANPDAFTEGINISYVVTDILNSIWSTPSGSPYGIDLQVALDALKKWCRQTWTGTGLRSVPNEWGRTGRATSGFYRDSEIGDDKCNYFVGAVLFDALGIQLDFQEIFRNFPPSASHWLNNAVTRSDDGKYVFIKVTYTDIPSLGDIISQEIPGGFHVGISLGRGIYISASTGLNFGIGTVQPISGLGVKSDKGMRSPKKPPTIARVQLK
ncbi:MAG: DUF6531 domain-containing protein [Planctomycetota bacterium]